MFSEVFDEIPLDGDGDLVFRPWSVHVFKTLDFDFDFERLAKVFEFVGLIFLFNY